MKYLLYFLLLSVLTLYLPIQSFADIETQSREHPSTILTFDKCRYPSNEVVSTYVFQGPLSSSKTIDKSMDNYNKKNISIKISNFDYFLDKNKNITKGYISITQPNASSFNNINIADTYTMCTSSFNNKLSDPKLVYIEYLHNECPIKEINLKGTTNINPAVAMASEPKDFKLQVYGIPNATTPDAIPEDHLKEIKGLIKIGNIPAAINDIAMDVSCIHDRYRE